MTDSSRVAVIGVGRMGGADVPPAPGRRPRGESCRTIPPRPAVGALCAEGADRAEDPAEAARRDGGHDHFAADPGRHRGRLTLARAACLSARPRGACCIDMSTSLAQPGPATRADRPGAWCGGARCAGHREARAGAEQRARWRSWSAGEADAFARALPRCSTVLGSVIARHMGGPGSGQATKLTNNLLAATHMAVLAEAVPWPAPRGSIWPKVLRDRLQRHRRLAGAAKPLPGARRVLEDAPANNGGGRRSSPST